TQAKDGASTPPPRQSMAARKAKPISSNDNLAAYDRLTDGLPKTAGFNGRIVTKVLSNAIRDELKSRGFLDAEGPKGGITAASRKLLQRAKSELLKNKLVEKDGLIWRP